MLDYTIIPAVILMSSILLLFAGQKLNRKYRKLINVTASAFPKILINEVFHWSDNHNLDKSTNLKNKINSVFSNHTDKISESKSVSELEALREELEETKKENALLRQNLQSLKDLLDNFPAPVYYKNLEGKYIGCNERFAKLFDKSADEVIGMTVEELIPQRQGKWFHELDLALLKEAGGQNYEATLQITETETKQFQFHKTTFYDKKKQVVGIVGVLFDITERNKLQRELNQALAKSDAVNKSKNEFLTNMSHEIRTPLNGILGYAQLLRNDLSLQEKTRKRISHIENSGKHLLHLINDILDLSKIEAQRYELNNSEFSLANTLHNIIGIGRILAQKRGLHFEHHIDKDLPPFLFGDERKVRQILLNLINNAVKYTETGKITLRVKNEELVSGHSYLRFEIEDTGIGVGSNDLGEIFKPFKRKLEPGKKIEGNGLGLAISRELTRLIGGELFAESTPGKGSTFTAILNLPAANGSIRNNENEQLLITGYEGSKKKILFVDDTDEFRQMLIDLLEPLHFEVIEADNGQTAIELAYKEKPHLILMDFVMPIMDGFESVRRIRRIKDLADIKIIALSASVFEEHRRSGKISGCNDFLPKPIDINTLLEAIRTQLSLNWKYTAHHSPANNMFADSSSQQIEDAILTSDDLPEIGTLKKLLYAAQMGDIRSLLLWIEEAENEIKLKKIKIKMRKYLEEYKIEELISMFQSSISKLSVRTTD